LEIITDIKRRENKVNERLVNYAANLINRKLALQSGHLFIVQSESVGDVWSHNNNIITDFIQRVALI
jgi:hypothetical protein